MKQHPLACQSGRRLKPKHVKTLAAPPRPRVDWLLEPLQGPVRGHHDGTKAATRKAVLVEPGEAISRGRVAGKREIPGSVERTQLGLLPEGGCDRRQKHGVSRTPQKQSRIRPPKTQANFLVLHFVVVHTSITAARVTCLTLPRVRFAHPLPDGRGSE